MILETCGQPQGDSYARWDAKSSYWKTPEAFLFQSEENDLHQSPGFSASWETTGSMRNGSLWLRPTLELRSSASACFSWPVAVGSSPNDGESPETWLARAEQVRERLDNGNGMGLPLTQASQQFNWPAVTTQDGKNNGALSQEERNTVPLNAAAAAFNWPGARSEDGECCGNHPQAMDSLTGTTEQFNQPAPVENWKTPHGMATHDHTGKPGAGGEFAEECTLWMTPNVPNGGRMSDPESMDTARKKIDGSKGQVDLNFQTASWATPAGTDGKRGNEMPQVSKDRKPGPPKILNYEAAEFQDHSQWATPNAPAPHDSESSAGLAKGHRENYGEELPNQAGEATASLQDQASYLTALLRMFLRTSKEDRWEPMIAFLRNLLSGRRGSESSKSDPTSPLPSVQTKRRRLNPKFVEFLMGFPEGWVSAERINCEPSAMASCLSSAQ